MESKKMKMKTENTFKLFKKKGWFWKLDLTHLRIEKKSITKLFFYKENEINYQTFFFVWIVSRILFLKKLFHVQILNFHNFLWKPKQMLKTSQN